MSRILLSRSGLMAATAMALTLAACNKSGTADSGNVAANQTAEANGALPALPAAVPLQQGDATPIAAAPAVAALPAAGPIKVAQTAQPSGAYAYLDRANGVMDAIGDAPPDYAYDDGDVSPWAWQTGGGDVQYAEPVDGGYRYYYYQPGADTPYLVRDPRYSYAYSGDQLVGVYDDRGDLLPPGSYGERADYASRYYARAAYLHRLSRERAHRGVIAANWAARRSEIAESRAQWSGNRARQADWQAYHQSHADQEQDHWVEERQRRQAETQRFDRWQREGLHNPPPPPAGTSDDRDRQRAGDARSQQQDQTRRDQMRRDDDQRAAQDRVQADQQREHDDQMADRQHQMHQAQQNQAQQNQAQRAQAMRDHNRDLQHDQDQRLALQRAASDRRQAQVDQATRQQAHDQAASDRRRAQENTDQARARSAMQQQRHDLGAAQHQAQAQVAAQQQRQSDMREQASQAHAEAAQRAQGRAREAADRAEAHQQAADHAQRAHGQPAAQHAERPNGAPSRPPGPHDGEGHRDHP